jgi:hypothetical protein
MAERGNMPNPPENHLAEMLLISDANVQHEVPLTRNDIYPTNLRNGLEKAERLVKRRSLFRLESYDHLHTKSKCTRIHVRVVSTNDALTFKPSNSVGNGAW